MYHRIAPTSSQAPKGNGLCTKTLLVPSMALAQPPDIFVECKLINREILYRGFRLHWTRSKS